VLQETADARGGHGWWWEVKEAIGGVKDLVLGVYMGPNTGIRWMKESHIWMKARGSWKLFVRTM
jgi:hypothetical protein